MNSVRLFDTQPYEREATAQVVSCRKAEYDKNPCYVCELDRTIFFPEEGGQSPDKGTINGIELLDVQVNDGQILHYVGEEIPEGTTVRLCLDWKHRFSNMQQHSGEHIFSGTVHRLFGFDNVGFHLSDHSVTMDFNGVLSADDLEKVESIVNEAIAADVEIQAEYVDAETLSTLQYRSKKELEGPVRIVTIPGYDVCACCAPHVRRTGEIGMVKIVHSMNYKGGVRIHILCGFRALKYYRESLQILDSLTDLMTTGRENLTSHVAKLKTDLVSLTGQLMEAKQKLLQVQLDSIPKDQENIILFQEKTDNILMKNTVNRLLEQHKGLVVFMAGSQEDGYQYMLASKSRDTREVQRELAKQLQAKGGGKPEMVCGSVKAEEEIIKKLIEDLIADR